MKILWLSLIAIACHQNCLAQDAIDPAIVQKIMQAEFADSHIPQLAQELTDQSGGRLTGSPGFKRAADWAVQEFKKWHVSYAGTESWGPFGIQWEAESFSLEAVTPYYFPIHAYPVPWSPAADHLQGEVTTITREQSLDAAWLQNHAAQFKDKFILIESSPVDTHKNFGVAATRYDQAALDTLKDTYMISPEEMKHIQVYLHNLPVCRKVLKQAGAIGIIAARGNSDNGVVMNQATYGFRKNNPMVLPEVDIANEDAQRISRLKKVVLKMNLQVKASTEEVPGMNVIAELKGSNPQLNSQVVMLGAHLDSWTAATGATDNAAGCVVMMEALRLLDSLKLKPGRTIRVALWGGEEQGLHGSFNYVTNHFREKKTRQIKPSQSNISVYFNLDNGTGRIRGIFAQNNTAVVPIFKKWFAPFDTLCANTITLHNTGSTDHLSFDWAGIPAFQFIQDPVDYNSKTHHTNLDDYDHLQIEDLKQAAVIIACFAYQASIRDEKLPAKAIDNTPFIFDGF
ncbi:MAG: family metallo-hydrolase [Bacteroidetes bacterium]|nr:family metallo-hydrolase [Bacteroidota bacterium]